MYIKKLILKKIFWQILLRAATKCFGFKAKGLISQKELQYLTYEFKMSTNLGKFYLLPQIY